jgi:hypothetical protein
MSVFPKECQKLSVLKENYIITSTIVFMPRKEDKAILVTSREGP